MTDHTNAKRMVLDFLQAGLDHLQMSLDTVLIITQTEILLCLGRGLQEFVELLLLFLQPFLNSFV